MRPWIVPLVLLLAACRAGAPDTAPRAGAAPVSAPAPATEPASASGSTANPAVEDAPAVTGTALPPPGLVSPSPPTDAWLGKWVGPEGTLLTLSRNGQGYDVAIQSLDGPATYAGVPVGDHVEFTRAGKRESLVAGNGAATGMKWLADKQHCLVIRPGEGFCRD